MQQNDGKHVARKLINQNGLSAYSAHMFLKCNSASVLAHEVANYKQEHNLRKIRFLRIIFITYFSLRTKSSLLDESTNF